MITETSIYVKVVVTFAHKNATHTHKMWLSVVRSRGKAKPSPQGSVFVCSHSACICVMWLHASLHGRLFFFVFLNFDLTGVITCHACCVFLSTHSYSCNFPIWKGEKKHSHQLTRPADVREKLTWVNKRSMKRETGRQTDRQGDGETKERLISISGKR